MIFTSGLYISLVFYVAVHDPGDIPGTEVHVSLQAHRVTEAQLDFLAVIPTLINEVLAILQKETRP